MPGEHYAKLELKEAGTYKLHGSNHRCYASLYDENGIVLNGGFHQLVNSFFTVDEPTTYYLQYHTIYDNGQPYDITLDFIPEPVKLEVVNYNTHIYEELFFNNTAYLSEKYLLTFKDGTTKEFNKYDDVWYDYGLRADLYNANGEVCSQNGLTAGNYVWKVTSSVFNIIGEAPITVVSAKSAPKITLGKTVQSERKNQIYCLEITEDGVYEIAITNDESGSVRAYGAADGTNYLNGYRYKGYEPGRNPAKLKKGVYYVCCSTHEYYGEEPAKECVAFVVKKMPDIKALSYDGPEKLDIQYGVWGYYVNTVSGNQTISGSYINKTPKKPGQKLTGTTISGNYSYNDLYFDISVDAELADGSEEAIGFNSSMWRAYEFVEKLYCKDGSSIYLDANGYIPIGEYIAEFAAHGKSVKIPFSVVSEEQKNAVKITGQPGNVIAADGATASVKVEATGVGLKYQWYYTSNGSSSYFNKSGSTTATYSTTMDASKDGRKVYCVITDKYGNKVTSNTVTLKLKAAESVKITKQPVNVTVNKGGTASVSVTATGEGLKYQWYYTSSGASSYFNKSSNTTSTYSTTMDESRDGRKVYCVVTDKYGDKVTSNTVTLKMSSTSAVKITKQPVDVTVSKGATATVSVTATGDGLKYQWYYTSNGSTSYFNKSSNTTNTYSTSMDATRDGRKVYCVVTDKYGNKVTSNTVTLKMSSSSAVKITKQPVDVTVSKGATATVSVTATGVGLKYQWYYTSNGSTSYFNKSSNTTNTYSTSMDATRDGRKVYCVVTDKNGNKVTSNTVTLKMSSSSAVKITKQPVDVTVSKGATAKVSVTATGDGLKYQWYYTSNGSTSYFNKSSNTTNTYSTSMDATRDGRKVYCVVTDKNGNKVTSNTVTLKMSSTSAVKITKQPVDVTVAKGATATVSVTATGDGLKYQWYYTSNGSTSYFNKSSNTTNTYSTSMDATRDGRKVYCVVTDKNGNKVTSNTVTLKMSK